MKFCVLVMFLVASVIINFGQFFIVQAKNSDIHYLNHSKDALEGKYEKSKLSINSLKGKILSKKTDAQILINENIKLKKKIKELSSTDINETKTECITKYILTYYKKVPPILAKEISRVILEKAAEHNVPYPVIMAVTEVESNFNPFSVSKLKTDPARGLMQVRYNVWKETLGLKSAYDLHSISGGIDAGTRVLRKYLDDTKNDLDKTLYKYVGKNASYVNLVYNKMGKFTAFESSN